MPLWDIDRPRFDSNSEGQDRVPRILLMGFSSFPENSGFWKSSSSIVCLTVGPTCQIFTVLGFTFMSKIVLLRVQTLESSVRTPKHLVKFFSLNLSMMLRHEMNIQYLIEIQYSKLRSRLL